MRRCYTLKHFCQVLKVVFSLIVLGLIYAGICKLFGKDSIVAKLFMKNFFFKAYNIVGIILIILFACGIWVGRKNAKILFSVVSAIMLVLSIISYIPNVIEVINQIINYVSKL